MKGDRVHELSIGAPAKHELLSCIVVGGNRLNHISELLLLSRHEFPYAAVLFHDCHHENLACQSEESSDARRHHQNSPERMMRLIAVGVTLTKTGNISLLIQVFRDRLPVVSWKRLLSRLSRVPLMT